MLKFLILGCPYQTQHSRRYHYSSATDFLTEPLSSYPSSRLPAAPLPAVYPGTTTRAALFSFIIFVTHHTKPLSHLHRIIRNRHTLQMQTTGLFLCRAQARCIAAGFSQRQSSGHVQTTVVVRHCPAEVLMVYSQDTQHKTSWRLCSAASFAVTKWPLLSFAI